jgi:hypothetical protein
MTGEEDRFIIAPVGSTQRWTVHRPIDPHGEGCVHIMLVEISDDGLTAGGYDADAWSARIVPHRGSR